MGRLGLLATVCVILAWTTVRAGDEGRVLPDDPLTAARTFESKQCIRCHLIDFRHQGYGPDLGRISLSNNVFDIVGLMWNAAPDMVEKMNMIEVKYPELTAAEMTNVLAFIGVYQNYVMSYSHQADVENGARLFKKRKCASCHSFDPKANTVGPNLLRFRGSGSPLKVLRAMWLHSYYMRKAGVSLGIDWPIFKTGEIADVLAFICVGDGKVTRVRSFLQPGSPLAGKKAIVTYDCVQCHSVMGVGADKAPDLGHILDKQNTNIYIILEALWNHSPKMWNTFKKKGQRAPRISTGDLADILAYLFFINFDQSVGNKEAGRKLFESKSCANCHETDFLANDKSLNKMNVLAAMWNHVPEMLTDVKRAGIEWPKFSLGEMSSLVEYIAATTEK